MRNMPKDRSLFPILVYHEVLNHYFGKLYVTLFTIFIPHIKLVIFVTKIFSEWMCRLHISDRYLSDRVWYIWRYSMVVSTSASAYFPLTEGYCMQGGLKPRNVLKQKHTKNRIRLAVVGVFSFLVLFSGCWIKHQCSFEIFKITFYITVQ